MNGSAANRTCACNRFQFSLAQLILMALSVGGCISAWYIGWVSLALPIILGWLWWFAYGRTRWIGQTALCLFVPAALLWVGCDYVVSSQGQSQAQRALPLDWEMPEYAAARERQRQEELRAGKPGPIEIVGVPSIALSYMWTWGVLAPLLLAATGLLLVQRPWVRRMRLGWSGVGIGLGLMVVLVLAGYPVIRASVRKSPLRDNWHQAEVTYYEGPFGSNQFEEKAYGMASPTRISGSC